MVLDFLKNLLSPPEEDYRIIGSLWFLNGSRFSILKITEDEGENIKFCFSIKEINKDRFKKVYMSDDERIYFIERIFPKISLFILNKEEDFITYLCLDCNIDGEGIDKTLISKEDFDKIINNLNQEHQQEIKGVKSEEKGKREEIVSEDNKTISDLKTNLGELQKEYNSLKRSFDGREKKINKLDEELKTGEKEVARLKNLKKAKLEKQVKELEKQIEGMYEEHQKEFTKLKEQHQEEISKKNAELKGLQGVKKRLEMEKKEQKPTAKMEEAYKRYIIDDELQKDIAKDMGKSKDTINKWILKVKIAKQQEQEKKEKEVEEAGNVEDFEESPLEKSENIGNRYENL